MGGGGGGVRKNSFRGGSMDILWNYTLLISAIKDKFIWYVIMMIINILLFYLQLANHSFELQKWNEVHHIHVQVLLRK